VFLVDHLDAKHSGLVGELYSAGVLSQEERDNVSSELTSFAQNEKMLSMLSRKTKDQFDKFLDALDQTAQQHVRNRITGRQRLFRSCCFCCFLLVLFIFLTLSNVICRVLCALTIYAQSRHNALHFYTLSNSL